MEATITPTRRVSTDLFSIELPESLEEIPMKGDASQSWQYVDESMTVDIEFGLYVPAFGDDLKKYNRHCEEFKFIDGEQVKIVSSDFERDKSRRDPSKSFFVGASFQGSNRLRLPMAISISFRSMNEAVVAYKIIESIRISK